MALFLVAKKRTLFIIAPKRIVLAQQKYIPLDSSRRDLSNAIGLVVVGGTVKELRRFQVGAKSDANFGTEILRNGSILFCPIAYVVVGPIWQFGHLIGKKVIERGTDQLAPQLGTHFFFEKFHSPNGWCQ